jgi:hypothetical protein
MTRLRRKGEAKRDTLYDLLNGYVTQSGTIVPRPGTVLDTALPAGTKGIVAHKSKLYVFGDGDVTMTDTRYRYIRLRHPDDPTATLEQIHFAQSFMGNIYVVASYSDTSSWHFWVEELDEWEADTTYKEGDRVYPTTPNGFMYKATRKDSAGVKWAAGVERSVNDVVEPTVANGFEYTVVSVSGSRPASGSTEPTWPTEVGAQVVEQTYGAGVTEPAPEPGESTDDGYDSGDIEDRYRNPAGEFPFEIEQ